jgi:hypothetical protein
MLGVEGSEKRPVQDEDEERSLELLNLSTLPLMSPPQGLQGERRSGSNQRCERLDREFCQEHLRGAGAVDLPSSYPTDRRLWSRY